MTSIVDNQNLRLFWEERAAANAGRTAVIYENDAGEVSSWSYAALNQEINQVANLFIAHGVQKGDAVIVQMTNTPAFLKVWFGLAKIGAVIVPINTGFKLRELHHPIQVVGARFCVCDAKFLPAWRQYAAEHPGVWRAAFVCAGDCSGECADAHDWIDLEAKAADMSRALAEIRPIDPRDPAEVLFTSGTTSLPKGALITHANLLYAGQFTAAQARMDRDDRLLTTMPNFHVDFQCSGVMPILTVAGTLIMAHRFSAHRFWGQIRHHRATLAQAVPMMLRTVMLQPVAPGERDHQLRDILYALSMRKDEYEAFKARFGVDLINSYGMTETLVGVITVLPEVDRHFPSVGRPFFGYEAKIAGPDGSEAPRGTVGDFWVRGIPGETIFAGYVNNPEATRQAFSEDGWFKSSDKGVCDEAGWFWFVDRSINMIKRSGENISSTEVEDVLAMHPAVAEAAVIGVPDPIRDEAVFAYVSLKPGQTATKQDLLAHCKAELADFKVPSYIEFREGFERTCTGKIVKDLLKREDHSESERLC